MQIILKHEYLVNDRCRSRYTLVMNGWEHSVWGVHHLPVSPYQGRYMLSVYLPFQHLRMLKKNNYWNAPHCHYAVCPFCSGMPGYCLFLFMHVRLKWKTHPECDQRGVPSLECMVCLKYLENLSKEACAMAEWHVCLQPCVTAWGTAHMLVISPDVMLLSYGFIKWLWNITQRRSKTLKKTKGNVLSRAQASVDYLERQGYDFRKKTFLLTLVHFEHHKPRAI